MAVIFPAIATVGALAAISRSPWKDVTHSIAVEYPVRSIFVRLDVVMIAVEVVG